MPKRGGTAGALPKTSPPLGYKLGERMPETLPGWTANSESMHENRLKSREWSSWRKTVQSTAVVGMKVLV